MLHFTILSQCIGRRPEGFEPSSRLLIECRRLSDPRYPRKLILLAFIARLFPGLFLGSLNPARITHSRDIRDKTVISVARAPGNKTGWYFSNRVWFRSVIFGVSVINYFITISVRGMSWFGSLYLIYVTIYVMIYDITMAPEQRTCAIIFTLGFQ